MDPTPQPSPEPQESELIQLLKSQSAILETLNSRLDALEKKTAIPETPKPAIVPNEPQPETPKSERRTFQSILDDIQKKETK